ncbi:helix-turn-helix domain-containing protein [Methylobacterium aquaticum]|uniref:Transposase n=1 Tax=Methylobacterium aquaticum TaxID=270351 RepID=A0A0C6G1U2_9HYPH|nr:transposase [Methylobacterium aquaticum]
MPERSLPHDAAKTEPVPETSSRRRDRCEAALRLHGEGQPTTEIARRLGASRNAARRWIRAGQFMPYRRAPGPSRLDRYISVVEARWQDGQRNATVLHRELCAQGFTGGYDIIRRWAARQRSGVPARPPSARIPSTRRITRWLTGDPAVLSPEERAFTEALCKAAPRLKRAAEDVRVFADLLHQDDPAGLTPWLEAAATELGGFVTGLRQDEDAMRAAIAEPWSNGQVEGQVNRPKLIKRSMYGRAKFDLLRQRVLHAA